jgi:hypothetical protein
MVERRADEPVFSGLLGFSQPTANNWDGEASGFSPNYGAEVA